jgi:Ca-activated chloride channel family protein
MNATDVAPTRLIAAQRAAKSFVDQLPGKFRVGVVSFSASADTLTRPTTDRGAVRDAIDSLQAQGGTAMGDAIERALDTVRPAQALKTAPKPGQAPPTTAVPQPKGPPAIILLLSDGASSMGKFRPLDAAMDAHMLNVPVFTIALGTMDGTVDVPDDTGQGVRRIPVPPDPDTLSQVAKLTGGRFFNAPNDRDLRSIYHELGSRIGFVRERQEVTVVLAAIAVLLLVSGGIASLAWFSRFP